MELCDCFRSCPRVGRIGNWCMVDMVKKRRSKKMFNVMKFSEDAHTFARWGTYPTEEKAEEAADFLRDQYGAICIVVKA